MSRSMFSNPSMRRALAWACASAALAAGTAGAATPAEVLAGYASKAAAPASAERGQKLFVSQNNRDFPSCTSCHGTNPLNGGKDQVSEKAIGPLAPAANPKRFTDPQRVEASFSLNCKEVLGRACTVQEKADVMTWLLSLKP